MENTILISIKDYKYLLAKRKAEKRYNEKHQWEAQKKYYENNIETIAEKYKTYGQIKKDEISARKKLYYQANKEAIRKYQNARVQAKKAQVVEKLED